jgi:hypothetical protein
VLKCHPLEVRCRCFGLLSHTYVGPDFLRTINNKIPNISRDHVCMSQIFSQSGFTPCVSAIFSDTSACDTSCCAQLVCKKYYTHPLSLHSLIFTLLMDRNFILKGNLHCSIFWSHMTADNADLSLSC